MVQTIDSLEKKTLLIAPKKPKDIPDVKHALVKVPSIYTRENADLAEHISLENCFCFGLCEKYTLVELSRSVILPT